ncbi:TPA: hypothetical protein QCY16_004245 [Bacillus cereus]|nr:hypothetical protein [Bacillus cereus]
MVNTTCASIITGILLICSTGCAYQTDFIAAKIQSVDGTYTTKDITEAFPVGTTHNYLHSNSRKNEHKTSHY